MTTYAATTNMPGFLPDGEAAYLPTIREAWDYLKDEYQRMCDEDELTPTLTANFDQMWNHQVIGALTSADLNRAFEVQALTGYVCADCGARFTTTTDAQTHWDDEHA